MNPAKDARMAMRSGRWTGPTGHEVPGYVQCNLIVLPKADAYDFLVYCQRNPKPCPLVDICEPGDPHPSICATDADLRTDLPRYNVFHDGQLDDLAPTDISDLWRDDFVACLIGSSLSFDSTLERAGVSRSEHVWVLNTDIPTRPSGRFRGNMIVTMRLMPARQAIIATQLTSRFPSNHGAPVHIGDHAEVGADLRSPIFGPPLKEIPKDMTPVFWACGVTPQATALSAKPEMMITHAPGHAFITDLSSDQICIP